MNFAFQNLLGNYLALKEKRGGIFAVLFAETKRGERSRNQAILQQVLNFSFIEHWDLLYFEEQEEPGSHIGG